MGISSYAQKFGLNDKCSIVPCNDIKRQILAPFNFKIEREPKEKFLKKKLSSNLVKYLFNFCNYKDVFELGKANLNLMNNALEYFKETEPFPEKIRQMKLKYNMDIFQNEVDSTEQEAKMNKRRYQYQGKHKNFFQFDIDGNRYIFLAHSYEWKHQKENQYWKEKEIDGSYEPGEKVYYLKTVCFIGMDFIFPHVKPNNYKFCLNEHFTDNEHIIERINLKVTINDDIIVYEKNFPNADIYNNNCDHHNKTLKEDFICYVKEEDFEKAKKDENGDCKVTIIMRNIDWYWKDGWYIDGGCLIEIEKERMEQEIKNMEQKKEKEEREKYFGRKEEKSDDEKNEDEDDD